MMKMMYRSFFQYLPLFVLLMAISIHISKSTGMILSIINQNSATITITLLVVVLTAVARVLFRPRAVYLVDFACSKPRDGLKTSMQKIVKHLKLGESFSEESAAFVKRVLERSGQGQETYFPASFHAVPADLSWEAAHEETDYVMFAAVDELLAKTGIQPKDIDVLITNCSVYNPTPSLSAIIVNKYKLRGKVRSYNLGGMGCSAGLISLDLAKQLLQVHPNSYALIVSTENITVNGYFGNYRPMLISNCLFRMGASAVLLSNCRADRHRAKYKLNHIIRTNKGADNRSYNCVMQEEDMEGFRGVSLSKDLMAVAGDALRTSITKLGPLVLPFSEQFHFLGVVVLRKVFNVKIKPYVPDFKKAFEHFCIHAGGRAVLDELERSLKLSSWHMEPSRMTLYRFGNTSSSSLWYELAYTEAKGRVKKGDRVWQIGFGSGFKCNSAMWTALKTIKPSKENPWMDDIDQLPVEVPNMVTIMI